MPWIIAGAAILIAVLAYVIFLNFTYQSKITHQMTEQLLLSRIDSYSSLRTYQMNYSLSVPALGGSVLQEIGVSAISLNLYVAGNRSKVEAPWGQYGTLAYYDTNGTAINCVDEMEIGLQCELVKSPYLGIPFLGNVANSN